MMELATAKTVIDLFKELVSFADRRRNNKRDDFARIVKPLCERVEPVAREYYAVLHEVVYRIEHGSSNLSLIINDANKRRADFIITRNGILGEAAALQR